MPAVRGSEITRRRRELGLKKPAFAPEVGISYAHLDNIENGRMPPSIELVHRLANRFSCKAEDLLADPEAEVA